MIAAYKEEHGLPVEDKAREAELIARNTALVPTAYRPYYNSFFSGMLTQSKRYQSLLLAGMRIAYSGVEGAFAHVAARRIFGGCETVSCPDFATAYRRVETGECSCAVLPIENSYAGDVSVVMDLAFSGSLYVNAVIETKVTHNLLLKKGGRPKNVKTGVSHPQALEQCGDFLRRNGFKTLEYSNTALAAKFVAEECDDTFAAIGSENAAENFGLDIAVRGINSDKHNTTRFAVFSRVQNLPQPSDPDESSHFILVFTAKNEAGSLAQALNIIGAHDFNMRTLTSRPMKELIWNYYFYVEADGNINSENGRSMLRELSAVCAKLKLVGSYK